MRTAASLLLAAVVSVFTFDAGVARAAVATIESCGTIESSALLAGPEAGPGADEERAARSLGTLATARGTYEKEMEKIRARVESVLQADLLRAQKGKDPITAVEAVNKRMAAWRGQGSVEGLGNDDAIIAQYGQAAKKLATAYAKAMADATASKNDALSEALSAEAQSAASHRDLAPWGEELLDAQAERALTSGGKDVRVLVKLPEDSEYRLQVVATLTRRGARGDGGRGEVLPVAEHKGAPEGGEPAPAPDAPDAPPEKDAPEIGARGVMTVEFPLFGGTRLTVPVDAGKDGKVRAIFTVRHDTVSADLGVTRPIDVGTAKQGAERMVVLRAVTGDVSLESVRVKPVIEGAPPEDKARPTAPAKREKSGAPPAGPVDTLQRGDKLTGIRADRHNNRPLWEAEIESLSDTSLVLVGRRTGNSGTRFRFEFQRNGDSLTLTKMTCLGASIRYDQESGKGTIKEDKITFKANYVILNNKGGGAQENDTYTLKKE